MLTLHFPKSRSKNYANAIKLASKFSGYTHSDGMNMVAMKKQDIFERWEYFNVLFWMIVDWKDMYVEFDDNRLYSHCDKTRIFYSVQEAHSAWMAKMGRCAFNYYKQNLEEKKIERTPDVDSLTNEQVDMLIDMKLIEKEFGK
jgi:hypothetical protein